MGLGGRAAAECTAGGAGRAVGGCCLASLLAEDRCGVAADMIPGLEVERSTGHLVVAARRVAYMVVVA